MGAGASKAQKKSQRAAELALAYNWESLEDWAHRCALERERAAAARAQTEEMEAVFADAPMPSAAAAAAAGTAAAAAAIPPDSPSRSLSGETGERLQAYREQRAAEGRPVSSSSLFPPPLIARAPPPPPPPPPPRHTHALSRCCAYPGFLHACGSMHVICCWRAIGHLVHPSKLTLYHVPQIT